MFKKFIFVVALTLLVSSCGVVNQVRLRTENLDLHPKWKEGVNTTTLETKYIGEKPFVYARVNGEIDLLFMVDTGATVSMLFDSEKTKSLHLEQGYDLKMQGWGDEEGSHAFRSSLKRVQLGDVYFKDVTVGYIPITGSKYFIDSRQAIFDGVIGWDLMQHFSWRFDKRNNEIRISSEAATPEKNSTVISFESLLTKPYIDAEITLNNNHTMTGEFIIDTGSRHYVKLKQEYLDNRDIDVDSRKVTAADFGLSGKAEHSRVSLPKLVLGDLTFEDVKTNLIRGGDEDEHWIIGSALLNQFVSIMDYHTSTLHLIPYPEHQFKTRFNLLGLELRKMTTGNFVVRYVMPDMAANGSSIKPGDVVVSINGKSTEAINSDQWLTLSDIPDTYEICFERQSKIVCDTVTSRHVVGYSKRVDS